MNDRAVDQEDRQHHKAMAPFIKMPILAAVLAISVCQILVLAATYESWSLPMVII